MRPIFLIPAEAGIQLFSLLIGGSLPPSIRHSGESLASSSFPRKREPSAFDSHHSRESPQFRHSARAPISSFPRKRESILLSPFALRCRRAVAKTDSRPCAFRPPSWRPSYFLLLVQEKVTKENSPFAAALEGFESESKAKALGPRFRGDDAILVRGALLLALLLRQGPPRSLLFRVP